MDPLRDPPDAGRRPSRELPGARAAGQRPPRRARRRRRAARRRARPTLPPRARGARATSSCDVHDFFADDDAVGLPRVASTCRCCPTASARTPAGWRRAATSGTTVVAPTCGYYAEQGPVLDLRARRGDVRRRQPRGGRDATAYEHAAAAAADVGRSGGASGRRSPTPTRASTDRWSQVSRPLRICLIAVEPLPDPRAVRRRPGGADAGTGPRAGAPRARRVAVRRRPARTRGCRCTALPLPTVHAERRRAGRRRARPGEWMAEHHAYLGLMLEPRARPAPSDFDVVHNNSLHHLPVAMAAALDVPMVTTLHTPPLAVAGVGGPACARRPPRFVGGQRAHGPGLGARRSDSDVVLNGVDPRRWPPGPGGGPAVWSGRHRPGEGAAPRDRRRRDARACRSCWPGPSRTRPTSTREIAPRLGDDARRTPATSTSATLSALLRRARGGGGDAQRGTSPTAWSPPRRWPAAPPSRPSRAARCREIVSTAVRRARRARRRRGPGRGRSVGPRPLDRAASARHAGRATARVDAMVDGYERFYATQHGRRRGRVIGYYVHHHGRGHLHRALAVGRRLAARGEPVTGLSSLPRPDGWAGDWVQPGARRRRRPAADVTAARPAALGARPARRAPLPGGAPVGLAGGAPAPRWWSSTCPSRCRCWPGCTGVPVVVVALPGRARRPAAPAGLRRRRRAWSRAWPRVRAGMLPAARRRWCERLRPVGGAVPLPGAPSRRPRRPGPAAGRRAPDGSAAGTSVDATALRPTHGGDTRLGVDRARRHPGDAGPTTRPPCSPTPTWWSPTPGRTRSPRWPRPRRPAVVVPAAPSARRAARPPARCLRRRPGRPSCSTRCPTHGLGRRCWSGPPASTAARLGRLVRRPRGRPRSPTLSPARAARARRRPEPAMSSVAVVTIAHGRHEHLAAQQRSLARGSARPDQYVARRDGRPRDRRLAPATPAVHPRGRRRRPPIPAACRWPPPATAARRARARRRAPTWSSSSTSTASPGAGLVAAYADAVDGRDPAHGLVAAR